MAGQSPARARPVPASVTVALHVTGWSPMGLRGTASRSPGFYSRPRFYPHPGLDIVDS